MFDPVNRWKRTLVRILVVAQLLAAAPFASAFPVEKHPDSMPCAGMMDMANLPADSHECPCCPDGTDSIAACLSACVAAVGISSSFTFTLIRGDTPRARLPIVTAHSRVSDPPTKPPPIA
jgi:hypothetical protein